MCHLFGAPSARHSVVIFEVALSTHPTIVKASRCHFIATTELLHIGEQLGSFIKCVRND